MAGHWLSFRGERQSKVDFQQDWIGVDLKTKGNKWQFLQARCSPEEKRDVFMCCKTVIKLPYSVITRLIWRRILYNYRIMPQARMDELKEIDRATDEVLEYIPVIRRQRHYAPREY
jgi:hypothetical protein